MQNHFGLLDTDVMPMFMIIALDVFIIMHFSINCSAVIRSPIVIHAISREATSEIYSPGSIFHYIESISFLSTCQFLSPFLFIAIFTFQSIQQKYQKYLLYYLYQISLLRVLGDLCVMSYQIDLSCNGRSAQLWVQSCGVLSQ